MQEHKPDARLLQLLEPAGLNMLALLPVRTLASRWSDALPVFGRKPQETQTLLLIGNSGPAFWSALQRWQHSAQAGPDPVDTFALQSADSALRQVFPVDDYLLLYPVLQQMPPCSLSLQALGTAAGWHQPSPLGMGIHARFGLWFAYRALVLLDRSLAPLSTPAATQRSVMTCAECGTLDCIQACPAAALAASQPPDMQRCIAYRQQVDSDCASRCLARNACPVGSSFRYNAQQIEYHYTVSLDSIRQRAGNRD